jgi:hypothetical protein
MRSELITIPTATTPLDGVLYERCGARVGAVLFFHGNTMNFLCRRAAVHAPLH